MFRNKNFVLAILLLTFFDLHSQSSNELGLNQEFLDSLPEETRNELVKQLEEDRDATKDVDFGVISTMMDKTPAQKYIEQELIKQKGRDIPSQNLTIEQLEVFGADFFRDILPSTYFPVSEPALQGEYLLDIGDTLGFDVIGSDAIDNAVIGADGKVSLSQIGNLQLAGLTLMEAEKRFNEFLKLRLPGATGSLELVTLRSMQIVIVGSVEKPGIYTLAGNSNVLSAIRAAGGISENGSFRKITVKRNGAMLYEYDLYELLILGNLPYKTALRSGDSVVVSPAQKHIAIYGGISRPAIYEIIGDESISDLIKFAGYGLNGDEIKNLNLSRIENGARTSRLIKEDTFSKITLENRDQLFIPFIKEPAFQGINLVGSFLNPGVYSKDQVNSIKNGFQTSNDAYLNALFIKSFNKESNRYSYKTIDPKSSVKVNSGDSLIFLSNSDIDFLQSSILRDYFNNNNNHSRSDSLNCKIFSYLDEIKLTARFNTLSSLYSGESIPLKTEDVDLDLLIKKEASGIESNDLFTKKNVANIANDSCPLVFNDDPELLVAVVQNSIMIDGQSLRGGLFPIYNGIKLKKVIDGLTFYYPINLKENLITVTNQSHSYKYLFQDIDNVSIEVGSNISISSKQLLNTFQVKISGEIDMPGLYYISPGDRLSDLLETAGGYTDNAYPLGGHLSRLSSKKLEEKYNDRLYSEIIRNLSSEILQGGVIQYQTISYILNEFKSIKPTGRVIAEFNPSILSRNSSSDIILENGDEIFIPKKSNVVYVFGEVLNPGPQVFSTSYSANDYLNASGGFTRLVDKASVILVYPDGKSKLLKSGIFPTNDAITPGTVIYASRDLRKLDNITLASTLAPIVSSIAISLASLNSISNN